jgi:hypothetical protein
VKIDWSDTSSDASHTELLVVDKVDPQVMSSRWVCSRLENDEFFSSVE